MRKGFSVNLEKVGFKFNFSDQRSSENLLEIVGIKTLENMTLKEISNFLQLRCAKLGYIPNFVEKNWKNPNELAKIKLFGDYTFFNDTAHWKALDTQSKLSDLELCKEEVMIITQNLIKRLSVKSVSFDLKIEVLKFHQIEDILYFLKELKI